jgi:hypothetical protein
MTLYSDDRAVIAHAEDVAAKAAKKKSRKVWLAAGLGTLLAGGGVAFAAMTVSSNEANAKVDAGTAQDLQLGDATASGPLYPGLSVDVSFPVKNVNPFPVTVTSIVAGSSQPTVTCATPGDVQYLSSSLMTSGASLTLAAPVTVQPNETKTITITKAVKLAPAATGGCSIVGKFKVSGSGAGSGN